MNNHINPSTSRALLRRLYKHAAVQSLAMDRADADARRQRLLRAYRRTYSLLYSPHSLSILAPIRSYRLSVLEHKIRTNLLGHYRTAVNDTLHQLITYNTIEFATRALYPPENGTDSRPSTEDTGKEKKGD